jgi:hypothetical protein
VRCPNCRSTAVQERPDPSSTLAPCQPQQAEKDAADRAAIIAALERQLKRGDKALVGYCRFIKIVDDGHFAIDRNKADEDVRFDGVFVLRTSQPELEARIAAFGQKGSWPAIISDLDALTETEVEQDGKRFMPRSAPRPAASLALRAAGVCTATERAVDRRRLIVNSEHVVPAAAATWIVASFQLLAEGRCRRLA